MIPKVFFSFLTRLRKETESGMVKWTQVDDRSLQCEHNSNVAFLARRYDEDEGRSYFVFILESGGKEVPFTVFDYETADYADMRTLYEVAAANANDASGMIASFF